MVVDVVLAVRGAIKEGKQRVKLPQALAGLVFLVCPQHALRLIDDENGARLANHVDRPAPSKLLQLHRDAAGICPRGVKGLRVDDHYVYLCIGGKPVDGRKPTAVVNKMLHTLAILFGKMVGHRLKTLDDTLANRHTRHNDDILRPAIVLVEFVRGRWVSDLGRFGFHGYCGSALRR